MKKIFTTGLITLGLLIASSCDDTVSGNNNDPEVEVKFSVSNARFEYEVTNTNDYTILISKNADTIRLEDYWAMYQQPSSMDVFAESSNDTLIISYNDTTTLSTVNDWMPTVKTTAQIVFDSGIEEINFVTVRSAGGRGAMFDEEISYRVANVDTTLSIE